MSTIVQLAAAKERRHIFQQAQLYQSFGSVEIMDEHVKLHLSRCSYLSPGTLRILNHLSGHSCKIPGVSFARISYIVEQTGLSERTVRSALSKLEQLGIVKRIPTLGMDGRRSVNLIVIQPCDADPKELDEDPLSGILEDRREDCPPPESPDPNQNKASSRVNDRRNSFQSNKTKHDDNNIDLTLFIDSAALYGMPEKICIEIAKSLRQQLDRQEYESSNRNDLYNAFRRATVRLMDLFKHGYHISSFGAFYIHLFRRELQRCRDLRTAG